MSATATRLIDNYVAGSWTPATDSSDALDVTNPATRQVLARVPLSGAGDLDAAAGAPGAGPAPAPRHRARAGRCPSGERSHRSTAPASCSRSHDAQSPATTNGP